MDWLNSIVKVEHPSLIPALLHSTLANYGEIDTFLPCNIEDAPTRHFFVRYNSPQAAQSAYNNQHSVQGLRVSTLCQDPRLLDQYLAACSLNMDKEYVNKRDTIKGTHYVPEEDAYTQSKTRRRSKGRKSVRRQLKKYPEQPCNKEVPKRPAPLVTSSSQLQKDALTHQPGAKSATPPSASANLSVPKRITQQSVTAVAFSSSSANPFAKRTTQQPSVKAISPSLTSASLSAKRPMQLFAEVAAPSSTSSKLSVYDGPSSTDKEYPKNPAQLSNAPYYSTRSSTVAVPAMFCMATKMELRVAGEQFIYDLYKLEDDPKSIIELLKLASAERAHWMIVGAFYRRRGKVHAAIKVMMELIEALEGQSVDEDKMKPIYLMLSGCEADLAKTVKDRDTSSRGSRIASTHYLNSQTWLQKVYGTFDSNPEQIIGTSKMPPRNCERLDNTEGRLARRASNVGEAYSNKRMKLCMD